MPIHPIHYTGRPETNDNKLWLEIIAVRLLFFIVYYYIYNWINISKLKCHIRLTSRKENATTNFTISIHTNGILYV